MVEKYSQIHLRYNCILSGQKELFEQTQQSDKLSILRTTISVSNFPPKKLVSCHVGHVTQF